MDLSLCFTAPCTGATSTPSAPQKKDASIRKFELADRTTSSSSKHEGARSGAQSDFTPTLRRLSPQQIRNLPSARMEERWGPGDDHHIRDIQSKLPETLSCTRCAKTGSLPPDTVCSGKIRRLSMASSESRSRLSSRGRINKSRSPSRSRRESYSRGSDDRLLEGSRRCCSAVTEGRADETGHDWQTIIESLDTNTRIQCWRCAEVKDLQSAFDEPCDGDTVDRAAVPLDAGEEQ